MISSGLLSQQRRHLSPLLSSPSPEPPGETLRALLALLCSGQVNITTRLISSLTVSCEQHHCQSLQTPASLAANAMLVILRERSCNIGVVRGWALWNCGTDSVSRPTVPSVLRRVVHHCPHLPPAPPPRSGAIRQYKRLTSTGG